jgi:hypothetical protein
MSVQPHLVVLVSLAVEEAGGAARLHVLSSSRLLVCCSLGQVLLLLISQLRSLQTVTRTQAFT